jgi:diguanylate cyclase (GGDEF)-like protein/PAS domain S-box-containing protein
MQDMALVSFVVDALLSVLLIFLWWVQRRDFHALYWGLGHLCLTLMVLYWYLPQSSLPGYAFRYEIVSLLAFGGWCGYWFGSRWALGDDFSQWRRELWVLLIAALLLRSTAQWGDPFESVLSPMALMHHGMLATVFFLCGIWFWQKLPLYRLLGAILLLRALITVVMPIAAEYQWHLSTVLSIASVAKVVCLFGFIYLVLDQIRQRYRATLDSLSHGFMIRDKAGFIRTANTRGAKLLGYPSRQQLQGKHVTEVLPRLTQQMADQYFHRLVGAQAKPPYVDEAELLLHNGQTLQAELISSPYYERGQLFCLVQLLDVSERKAQQMALQQAAATDRLTGLLNRHAFGQHIDLLRQQQQQVAVLVFDLDHFKRINDNFGPQIGDQLLIAVAHRLQQQHPQYVLARLGGDEFAIGFAMTAYSQVETEHRAEQRLQPVTSVLLQMFSLPLQVQGLVLPVSISIGSAVSITDGSDSDTLLKHAEIAMYEAKQQGRQRWVCFRQPMLERSKQLLFIDTELKQAISRQELYLVYQPIYQCGEPVYSKMEALLRWQSQTLGMVSPDRFIPVAEESGYIVQLGDWVLSQACQQLAIWQKNCHLTLVMSVNVSALQLNQPDFANTIAKLLQQYQLQPSQLELEITERVLLNHVTEVSAVFEQLTTLGVQISLDDFGTGYSSLSYLSRFPLQTLKIDRSFVQAMHDNQRSRDLVRAIVAMGQSLQLQLVAEGVETAEQAATLQALGCHSLQGYYLARPQSVNDITHQLRAAAIHELG